MEAKTEFLKKLSGLVALARENHDRITIEEVEQYFSDTDFTEEQMELVFDYLLAQKVVVKGYLKMSSQELKEETVALTEEEETYLKEYQRDLKAFSEEAEGERDELFLKLLQGDGQAKSRLVEIYLTEVVQAAKEMYHKDIFLGDLIQEGNVGLILGIDMITDAKAAHDTIIAQVKQSIQMFIEEHAELESRDKKMVEKVELLDESIQTLTEELGRKVTIDELAVYMGMTEEEIEDILRLTGEETKEEEV